MTKYLILILVSISGGIVAQKYPELPLNELITQEEQKAIGVSKLSTTEKENLRILFIEKYLLGFEEGEKQGIQQAAEYFAREKYPSTGDIIESQIDGDFEGWEGETIVKLMNGQIWQQTEYYYHYHYAFMPEVLIFKYDSGYKMKVDGVERSVGVTQLR